jgi:electron transfer flavoprotein alpha subunit
MSILAVMEQRGGAWNRMSFETLAAARSSPGTRHHRQRRGAGALHRRLAAELAPKHLEKVYAVEHALLKDYTPDAYTIALRQLMELAKPSSCFSRTPTRCAISCPSWPPRWARRR